MAEYMMKALKFDTQRSIAIYVAGIVKNLLVKLIHSNFDAI
ncbi:MAG: hypothetical protein ACR5K4_02315 [Sodalis sp. (in: enterobacteria)]